MVKSKALGGVIKLKLKFNQCEMWNILYRFLIIWGGGEIYTPWHNCDQKVFKLKILICWPSLFFFVIKRKKHVEKCKRNLYTTVSMVQINTLKDDQVTSLLHVALLREHFFLVAQLKQLIIKTSSLGNCNIRLKIFAPSKMTAILRNLFRFPFLRYQT